MNLFTKEYEECGTNINKLQSWWNIFLLKIGKKIICPNCKNEYKASGTTSFIGIYYSWILVGLVYLNIYLLESKWDIFILITFYVLTEFIIMLFLALKKADNKEFIKYYNFIYYLLTAVLSTLLLYFSFLFIFIMYSEFFLAVTNSWNTSGAISALIYIGGTIILISPLIIFISSKIINSLIKKEIDNETRNFF